MTDVFAWDSDSPKVPYHRKNNRRLLSLHKIAVAAAKEHSGDREARTYNYYLGQCREIESVLQTRGISVTGV